MSPCTSPSTTTSPLSDPYVKPVDRKIFTMSRDGSATAGQAFTVANKGNLDTEVRTALGTNPATGVADAFADQRINWLRGNQSDELSATGGYLRQRGKPKTHCTGAATLTARALAASGLVGL